MKTKDKILAELPGFETKGILFKTVRFSGPTFVGSVGATALSAVVWGVIGMGIAQLDRYLAERAALRQAYNERRHAARAAAAADVA